MNFSDPGTIQRLANVLMYKNWTAEAANTLGAPSAPPGRLRSRNTTLLLHDRLALLGAIGGVNVKTPK